MRGWCGERGAGFPRGRTLAGGTARGGRAGRIAVAIVPLAYAAHETVDAVFPIAFAPVFGAVGVIVALRQPQQPDRVDPCRRGAPRRRLVRRRDVRVPDLPRRGSRTPARSGRGRPCAVLVPGTRPPAPPDPALSRWRAAFAALALGAPGVRGGRCGDARDGGLARRPALYARHIQVDGSGRSGRSTIRVAGSRWPSMQRSCRSCR